MHTEIISCDSRQFYQELNIGVARPTSEELSAAPHHFIACRSVTNPFNVFTYEQEAIKTLDSIFRNHDTAIAVGGSGLYIEALCHGIALLPDPSPELRASLQHKLQTEGIGSLRLMLHDLDPQYYSQVDLSNGVRIQRALEVCLTTGKPYSQVIQQPRAERPFKIQPIFIERTRDELRERINQRVTAMMQDGLEQEAERLFPLRYLNTLNTVGYKEFFNLWDTKVSPFPLPEAQLKQVSDAICLNTWHYAKKQLTWLKKFSLNFQS